MFVRGTNSAGHYPVRRGNSCGSVLARIRCGGEVRSDACSGDFGKGCSCLSASTDCQEEGGACSGNKSGCLRTIRVDNGITRYGVGRSGSRENYGNCQIDTYRGYKLMFIQFLSSTAYAASDFTAPYQR